MLTIGEFSRICFVTRKTLRHYDEIGLLRPEHIAENGYRYYSADQLRTMRLIQRLKAYGFSLPEVAAALANPDADRLAERLLEKRRQMELELDRTRLIMEQLDGDVAKLKRRMDMMEQNITVKTVELEPMKLLYIRRKTNVRHMGELISELFGMAERQNLRPSGPPMAFYHDEEYNDDHSDIEVAVPVGGGGENVREYAGGLHCTASILGPYLPEAFTSTYAGLCKWIEDNGYRISGSPFDSYVRGGDSVEPKDYVTEVYFPIEK